MAALRTGAGAELLEQAMSAFATTDALTLGSRLRARGHPPDLVAAALTQAELRQRAVAKLGPEAGGLFFTTHGLEQATRRSVADHRAQRVVATLRHGAAVADLCCGIGGDLLALARVGLDVIGVELDPLTAAVARANLEVLGLTNRARLVEADATTVDRSAYAGVVCDPARRTARGRVFEPDAYAPPWAFVEEVLSGTACVKVAPGIPHERLPAGVEAEWVSDRGDVTEAALWSGAMAGPARRRATVLPADATLTEADDPGPGPLSGPLGYLYEPDGAVIRAGLVTAVAAMVHGHLVDGRIAYVTSERLVATPFARAFRVRDALPYDEKSLRAWVRSHNIGTLTIKKRGVGVEPEQLRRRLRPRGSAAATLVVTRVAGKATVLVVEPLP